MFNFFKSKNNSRDNTALESNSPNFEALLVAVEEDEAALNSLQAQVHEEFQRIQENIDRANI